LAKFLTKEWLEALVTTVSAHEGFMRSAGDIELTLQFEVPDAPEGTESTYYMQIANGQLSAAAGPAAAPDATITNDYETAAAISKGELNTQMAFMTGKLKVSGNMAKLMMNQALLGEYAKAAAEVEVEY
jgi:putative sterol carrier protein